MLNPRGKLELVEPLISRGHLMAWNRYDMSLSAPMLREERIIIMKLAGR